MAREMKDSGVAWIGAVPNSWNINSLSQLFVQVKNKNSNLQETNLLSLSYGKIKRKNIESSTGLLPESFDGYNIIEKDDIVLRLTDLQNDQTSLRVGLAEERGIITSAYLTIRKQAEISAQYLFYYLYSFDISKGFYGMGGGVRQGLNWDGVKWLKVLVPPFDEQERIAIYLSQKCAEIDTVIDKTRTSIEEYKKLKQAIITQAVTKGIQGDRPMKESGIEWIGNIPAGWALLKIGNLYSQRSEKVSDKDYAPLSVTMQGIVPQLATAAKTDDGENRKLVKAGDFVINSRSDRRGSCGISNYDGSVSLINIVLTPRTIMHPGYYNWLFHTALFADEFYKWGHGIVDDLWTTRWQEMKFIYVPVPPVKEQQEIANYLSNRVDEINTLIQKKERFLVELESYKKSLIYEYVTGKKEVLQILSQSAITFVDARALLVCRIIELLKPKGRIHLMKALYTVDCLLDLNDITQYQRQKHGPYDIRITEYEKILVQNGWVMIKDGFPVEYTLTKIFETYRKSYQANFGDVDGEVQRICAFLKPMKTSKAERVATLLAAWNDFLIDGILPTDQQLVQEVRSNWTPNKANSLESTWLGTLAEMKAHQIIPLGHGKHTVHMQDSGV